MISFLRQSRYVGYYERVVRAGRELPLETPLIVTKITLRGMHSVGAGDGSELFFTLQSRCHTIPFQANLGTRSNCKVSMYCILYPVTSRDSVLQVRCLELERLPADLYDSV